MINRQNEAECWEQVEKDSRYMATKDGKILPLESDDNPIEPNHYTDMVISPLEYITANKMEWCLGNVVKYISRYKKKNGVIDLKKALWYLEHQIELEDKEGKI